MIRRKKTQIKAFLMNQKNVGGIGNMYMHDILFKAHIHPQKKISDMSVEEIKLLYSTITEILNLSREKGAFAYESD
jgi:formamidopyrimidine-DNA glycosylase